MWLASATANVVAGDSQPIIVALISALGGVLVAVVGGLVSLARRESRDQGGMANVPPHGERIAVLEQRAEESEDRDDMQDRRLNGIERYLDRQDGDWRPNA